MSHRNRLHVIALTLLLLVLLFGGCATPRVLPVVAPVPPLPLEARQPPAPPSCQPSCSIALERLLSSLLPSPTSAAPPARPASAPISP